ncbi:DUF983 domain-containing protein [Tepidamorphus sp. 3E244]|uniref:DUF983 domain-containing protein n=1 Tax=Tepidamorphus sp. 3E244 TaxID=3385498 RepID=UPI0038FD0670
MSVEYAHEEIVEPPRSWWRAMRAGLACKCPACGRGSIFTSYLKVADTCPACGEELHHHRADDAPAYMVIFIVGHIVVPLMLWIEVAYQPAMWIHAVVWAPIIIAMSLALLPPVKGALVGLQWGLRMHGFGGENEEDKFAA